MSIKGDDKNRPQKAWWVYMVRCADGSIYTGCTTDLTRRVRQHNGEIRGGAKYTSARRPVCLIGSCPVENRSIAQSIEAQLKNLRRADKLLWCDAHRTIDDT